jgi:hypothetical protein
MLSRLPSSLSLLVILFLTRSKVDVMVAFVNQSDLKSFGLKYYDRR